MINGKTVVIEIKKLSNQFIRLLTEAEMQLEPRERLTAMQRAVLGYLVAHRGKVDVYQRNIEEEFNIRRSTATGILQLMEKHGLIRRESDPSDGRWKKIVLTDKAFRTAQKFAGQMKKYDTKIIKGISQEELAKFMNVLERIRKNIE